MRLLRFPFRYLGAAFAIALAAVATTAVPVSPVGITPVIVIVMENQGYRGIVGNSNAPFINRTMIPGGVLDTDYAAQLGSLPDYMVMTSGQASFPTSAPNIFAALGHSTPWREYMESMPSVCYTGATFRQVSGTRMALYERYHNPAIQYASVSGSSLCRNIVPLDSSFRASALPAFSYVVPNQCNNMHTLPANYHCPMWNGATNTAPNPVRMGDNWLASFVPQVAPYATIIVTWDEATPTNEQVATITYGVGVTPGTDSTAYSHSSLEAGLYSYFSLGAAPGTGATATLLPIP